MKSTTFSCRIMLSTDTSFRNSSRSCSADLRRVWIMMSPCHLPLKNNTFWYSVRLFNNYWTRLSKISWFVRGEQINYKWSVRHADKSRYFAITDFNNCFIIRSPSLSSYFNHFLAALGSVLPFFSRERGSNCAWAEYYLQQNTFRRYYAWADHYL